MTVEPVKIMEEDWDYLVVLDACRYDYFEKAVDEFFMGKLEKRISQGASTPQWLKRNFPGYYPDVVYVSASIYVNSLYDACGFDGRQHFGEIVDVCLFGWDETLGTVPPRRVVDAAFDTFAKFPGRRYIVHFIQPHEPYVPGGYFVQGYPPPLKKGVPNHYSHAYRSEHILEKLMLVLDKLMIWAGIARSIWTVRQAMGLPPIDWLLRQILGLPPVLPMDAVRRKYGRKGLREAYEANLRMVSGCVAVLSNQILAQGQKTCKPKIIVTADHGEMLGENGRYGHWGGRYGLFDRYKDSPILHVPWFTVDALRNHEGLTLPGITGRGGV